MSHPVPGYDGTEALPSWMKPKVCELCNGTGYFKSNTAEFEGPCPNGCCSECGKPINSEYHVGKSCFNGPWEDEEGR